MSRVDFDRDDALYSARGACACGVRSRRRSERRHLKGVSDRDRRPEIHDGQIVRLRCRRRPRLRALGGDGRLPGRSRRPGGSATVLRRHSAAERHRQSAYGPRAQQHAPGYSMPLLAHERPRRAVAAGRGPCRHRHANGGRTHAHGAAGAGPARLGTQGVRRTRLGVEGRIGRRDRGSAQAPRRLLRLEPRAVYARRRPVPRGRQGVRSALSRGARLQGQAPRQLGSQVPDRDLGPRGRAGRDEGLVQDGRARMARRSTRRRSPRSWPKTPTATSTTSSIRWWTRRARKPANV